MLSGVLQSFLFNMVVGIVGICFLVFGFVADWMILKILGALILGGYILLSILNPIRTVARLSREISEVEFDEVIDAAIHGEKKAGLSLYKRVVFALEDKIQQKNPQENE